MPRPVPAAPVSPSVPWPLPALLVLAAFLALAGCRSVPTPPEPFRNVYTQDRDTAPASPRDVDYMAIPDAVPKPEPRGKYGNKSPYTVLGKTYEVLPEARGYRETGLASWYGEKFHGHRTSSFEPYDMYAMTAAHKTLPIPSYVRVTNLDNDRSVVVRVNDRGPFHDGRIIDLSWAAAQKLGYAGKGTARVRVEAVDAEEPAAPRTAAGGDTRFFVQLGAFAFPDAARRLGEQARGVTGDRVTVTAGDDTLHRVRVGPWVDRAAAERARDVLRDAGIGSPALVAVPCTPDGDGPDAC